MRIAALLTLATLVVAAPGRASTFVEALSGLEKRLVTVDRPGLPIAANEPRNVDKRELLPRAPDEEERPFRLFRDLQVRRSGSAAHIVGAGLPVDIVSGVLPGTLLATRLGVEARGLGLYGIAGGGTFTAFHHVIPRRDVDPLQVETRSVPFGFLGLGAELRFYRAVSVAGEINWGRVLVGHADDRVVEPAADEAVQSAALALRIVY